MKKWLQKRIYDLSMILEMLISVILAVVIVCMIATLSYDIFVSSGILGTEDGFTKIISSCMNLAVGLELIKMLCRHTPGTVVEVLIFAIARQIVIAHASIWDTLFGVICVAILFATRKYLFLSKDDSTEIDHIATADDVVEDKEKYEQSNGKS